MGDIRNGIVHVVGPEQGRTQPGMTIVCGDSHTSTHGAFGALAYGIGTSEVEHVLATQTLRQRKAKNMRVDLRRRRRSPASAPRTIALAMIGEIGTGGGTGYVIEYAGAAIARAVDGRAHDPVQPDHRGRRPGRPDRAGRDHLRLYRRASPARPRAAAWDMALALLAELLHATRTPCSTARSRIDVVASSTPTVTWGTSPRGRHADRRPRARSGRASPTEDKRAAAAAGAGLHGPDAPASRSPRPRCSGCSSAPAPTAASRTCAPPPAIAQGPQGGRRRRAMVVPGSGLVKAAGRGRGPGRGVPGRRLRMARAGLLDVPGHERRQAGAGRALRLHLQPQLRGPPGPRRPHPPDEPRHGRRRRHRRPHRRRARSIL